jgi:GNAT superfamily N-acetyltransferase
VIREYRDNDLPRIRGCIVDLQEFERQIDERLRAGEAMADDYLHEMLARCRACAGTIFVAEHAGEVAGFVTILTRVPFEALDDPPPGEYALVADLLVREGFRRRGLGGALLQAAERYARAAGAVDLRVGVLSGNEAAASLYRRAEFAPYLETLAKRLDSQAT